MILCLANTISGLDFNLLGTLAASIDRSGVCLISDINTNDYSFHIKMDIVRRGNLAESFVFIIGYYYKILVINHAEIPIKVSTKFRERR